mmetsp:Transcript_26498/g.19853  ORF Transcript_26498/g.19853 Transcript_26498/m.19853 type:complete len:100 (+) Transcript_26498:266-565(+)
MRRAKNAPLPEKNVGRKRDEKAKSKEEGKKEEGKKEEVSDVEIDAKGNQVFAKQDFENPIIIHFETDEKDEEFKVNWKEVEKCLKTNFKKLKVIYSRAD